MKRSSGPRRTANLSDSLHQRLNMYAVAASAAGVGMLAGPPAAEGKIVYTPAHRVIREHDSYQLDLNHDKKIDFTITNSVTCTDVCNYSLFQVPTKGNNGIGSYKGSAGILEASALRRGTRIGPSTKFHGGHARMLLVIEGCVSTICYVSGQWENVRHRYLGLRFKIKGQTHYGWARFKVLIQNLSIIATLTGYAYETIPNKPIVAGKTQGPVVTTGSPASLGHLAAGASAIPAWRSVR